VRAAAAAGFSVIAADAYCDSDTRAAASEVVRLGYKAGGFDANDVRHRLLPLATEEIGLLYGSGFETQPWLLEELSEHCDLLGNQPETVRDLKDPDRFFSMLSRLAIPYPELSLVPPPSSLGWLSKRIGGSGGTHVVPVTQEGGARRYYQRLTPGQSISLLFLADGSHVQVVGYNLQLTAPILEMPYRYGGAVSRVSLPDKVSLEILGFAQLITAELGLQGLNSLDCLVHEDGIAVLEVNPRLSATFSLYDASRAGANLLMGHIQASLGRMPPALPPEQAQAHLIYYAPFDMAVPAITWPEWVADLPEPASFIGAQEPLCTVMASAADASQALSLARARVETLTRLVTNF
jgi:predicted ATP-grasp superfamily ATP-dependent carboligase